MNYQGFVALGREGAWLSAVTKPIKLQSSCQSDQSFEKAQPELQRLVYSPLPGQLSQALVVSMALDVGDQNSSFDCQARRWEAFL